jgi:hypothetical protein
MLMKILPLATTHKSSVSIGFRGQIMLILRILCYNGSLVAWTVVSFTIAKFKPLILYMPGFTMFYTANMFIFMILYDFSLLPACPILLYNHILTEGLNLCANRWPVCTLENFQWCVEPCFRCATILIDRCLPLIPKWEKRKSLLNWSVPYEE